MAGEWIAAQLNVIAVIRIHNAVPMKFAFPTMCLNYSIINGQLLSYHALIIWVGKCLSWGFLSTNCHLMVKTDYSDLSKISRIHLQEHKHVSSTTNV